MTTSFNSAYYISIHLEFKSVLVLGDPCRTYNPTNLEAPTDFVPRFFAVGNGYLATQNVTLMQWNYTPHKDAQIIVVKGDCDVDLIKKYICSLLDSKTTLFKILLIHCHINTDGSVSNMPTAYLSNDAFVINKDNFEHYLDSNLN